MERHISSVCDDYRQGALMGDLCEDLCVTQKVVYQRCLYYDKGKKVILADWQGRSIILKSKRENFTSYERFHMLDERETHDIPDVDLLFFVAQEVKSMLGLELHNSTVPQLWIKHLKQRKKRFSRAELASMWSLLQQEEYVFFQLLQDISKHALQVIGSCGHFYAVDYLLAGNAWTQNIFSLEEITGSSSVYSDSRLRWQAISNIALSFLDMIRHFDDDFSYRLHLCDIKPENFAIRRDLTVVAIDVDMAFFEPKMRDILEQYCTNDEDCNFFDCFSKCNLKTNKCSAERLNNNLQVICDKIFRHWFLQNLIGSRVSLALQIQLQQAVQRCAEPSKDDLVNKKFSQILISELYSLLQAGQKELSK
ncbi:divergent protein kinase domain 1C [Latimeria chalumnae]|uniref:divergent protein kinase domain 1C n=1 Tax=Latimeria chalumnae TaxID=7897 RepID=UPI00313E9321